jgi:hypothetical protein
MGVIRRHCEVHPNMQQHAMAMLLWLDWQLGDDAMHCTVEH